MNSPKVKAMLFMKKHSERVANKNMRTFCGRPLFHWILDSLQNSDVIDQIIINTDSDEIAKSATDHFDVIIHQRPDYLLHLESNEAFQLTSYDMELTEGDYFLQTHSTTPLVKPETIRQSVKKFFENESEYDSLFSVNKIYKRIYDSKYNPINHHPHKLIKTQDLPPIYDENSCIYIFSRKSFFKNKSRIGTKPYFFNIDNLESVDIDEEFDFALARSIMKKRISDSLDGKK